MKKAIVTGATNQIGYYLLPKLLKANFEVTAISRKTQGRQPSLLWLTSDFTHKNFSNIFKNDYDVLFHLAEISLLYKIINQTKYPLPKRIIAFSTTSIFTKANSKSKEERSLIHSYISAEEKIITYCNQHNIHLTIFRPTMIYGCGRDKNITFITKFIKKFGFFPLLGQGIGKRQPVHAEDLAQACIDALECPATYGQSYILSGGEILSYQDLVIRIFNQLNKKVKIIRCPKGLFLLCLGILKLFPRYQYLSPQMANRMNCDLVFSFEEAERDFGYRPRGFGDNIGY